MGSDKHYPEEAPPHEVTIDGFWMDTHTATNEEFRRFVEATKYVTSAERAPNPDDYPGAKPELLIPALPSQVSLHRAGREERVSCVVGLGSRGEEP